VLLIACANFMNLTTARSAKRAKEVGIRKTIGAARPQLVRQFLGESLSLSVISTCVAILILVLALPWFNRLTGKGLTPAFLADPLFLLAAAAVALGVGLSSGIYPALFLSAFRPIQTLKAKSPGIETATTSTYVPTGGSAHYTLKFEGLEGNFEQVIYSVDKEFVDTYGLTLLAGKTFERPLSNDGPSDFLISESSTRQAGYSNPQDAVGKSMEFEDYRGQVVGIVNDINIYSLHRQPNAITYILTPIAWHNYLSLRIKIQNVLETLAHIRRTWQAMVPSYPLDFAFLDDSFLRSPAWAFSALPPTQPSSGPRRSACGRPWERRLRTSAYCCRGIFSYGSPCPISSPGRWLIMPCPNGSRTSPSGSGSAGKYFWYRREQPWPSPR
jgi:hypothetical protein